MNRKFLLLTILLTAFQTGHAVDVTARMEYTQFDQLTSPITGVIKTVPVNGKQFSQGDELVRFDSTVIDSRINSLKSQQKLQKKTVEEAKREMQRSQDLYDGTMLSDHELKLEQIKLLQAQADLAEVNHQLVKMRWKKKHFILKAPYNGYVVENHSYPGKYVANRHIGTELMGYVAQNAINVMLELNQKTALQMGDQFNLSYAGIQYSAQVTGINQHNGQGVVFARLKSTQEVIPPNGSLVRVVGN